MLRSLSAYSSYYKQQRKELNYMVQSILLILSTLILFGRFLGQPDELFAQEDIANNEKNYLSIVNDSTEQYYKPRISWIYGFNKNSYKSITGSFTTTGMLELRLGREYLKFDTLAPEILEYKFSYLSVCNILSEIGKKSQTDKIHTDLWSIGLGAETGYGYEIKKSNLVMYNASGMQWSWLTPIDYVVDHSDSTILSRFDGIMRFGTNAKSGIKIQFVSFLAADLGYERTIIFPAHLFTKWLGSAMIEVGGQVLIDALVNMLKDTSPRSVPIVSMLLKGGFSYGLYELRRSKMNWPFNSYPPFMIDSFKIGLIITY